MLESELYDREFNDNLGGRDAGELNPAVPAAVFQPPPVVFQPPPARPEPVRPEPAPSGQAASPAPAGTGGNADGAGSFGDDDDGTAAGRRRRRRPSRGRGRNGDQDVAAEAGDGQPETQAGEGSRDAQAAQGGQGVQPDAADGDGQPEAQGARRPSSRTRSRRTSAARDGAARDGADTSAGPSAGAEAPASAGSADGDDAGGLAEAAAGPDSLTPDDPPDTVVHVREPNGSDDVRSVRGSTRLEAKKQRRREGRETGRRRPPIITESEFLARRESVERSMVVRQRKDRTQIAVLEDGVLVEHYVNRSSHQSYVGNVYLGKVQNVLPSMEAAFVDIGKGRNAVLYAGEVNFDVSRLEGQPKRIESALKSGQSVIVQVTKDPVGHKGARLTSLVSLPGRYLVYVPGASMTGISRKLPDTERNRLKQILKKVMPENAGVIVRTAAEGAAEEE